MIFKSIALVVNSMLALRGYFNGKNFVPLEEVSIKKNQKVIITVLDESITPEPQQTKPFKKYLGALNDESFREIQQSLADTEKPDTYEW